MDRSLRAPIGPLVVLYNIYKLGHRHGRRTRYGPRPLFLDVRDFRRRRCGIVRRPLLHRSLPHIVLPYPLITLEMHIRGHAVVRARVVGRHRPRRRRRVWVRGARWHRLTQATTLCVDEGRERHVFQVEREAVRAPHLRPLWRGARGRRR